MILDALTEAEAWLSRNEIAESIGKKRLSPHDIELLGRMERLGLVEIAEETRGITSAYIYRAIGSDRPLA
jgi:DNA-binding IclR family transcriptional regulator